MRVRSLVTARGRVGVAFDTVMAYGTVGGAWANVRDDLTLTVNAVTADFLSLSDTTFGWAAGAGVEVAFWGNWSAKLEYLHVNFGDLNKEAAIPGILGRGIAIERAQFHDNIVRVGLNYRFGPGMAPPSPLPVYSAAPRGYLAATVDAAPHGYVDATQPAYRAGVEPRRRMETERSVARPRVARSAPPPSEESEMLDADQTAAPRPKRIPQDLKLEGMAGERKTGS